jgi:hypothetical protein
MASANVTSVAVVCTTGRAQFYAVRGTITGLSGSGLVLRNNGGDDLAVSANGAFSFSTPVASGAEYSVTVFSQPTNPAQNCVATGARGTVTPGVAIVISVACMTNGASGILRITVATTGPNAAAAYAVYLDGNSAGYYASSVPANGSVAFALALGTHSVTLAIPPNCAITGTGIVSLTVAAGAPTEIAFSVACGATLTGTIHVNVRSPSGLFIYATYRVTAVRLPPGQYSYAASTRYGMASLPVPPGRYAVNLVLPMNCTRGPTSPNVTVVSGAIAYVGFTVTCH